MLPAGSFRRVIVIGDVHGCVCELEELLSRLEVAASDRLVFLGDLIDRGPDSPGAVQLVRKACAAQTGSTLILGNHEQKLFKRHARQAETSAPEQEWVQRLTDEDWMFLRSAVVFSRDTTRNLVFVHGGFFPRYFEVYGRLPPDGADLSGLDRKHRERISRFTVIRFVNSRGDMVGSGEEDRDCRFWAELCNGREGLACFGHSPEARPPRVFPHAINLDAGCVYGGGHLRGTTDRPRAAIRHGTRPGAVCEFIRLDAMTRAAFDLA
jgi:hypothetical protein